LPFWQASANERIFVNMTGRGIMVREGSEGKVDDWGPKTKISDCKCHDCKGGFCGRKMIAQCNGCENPVTDCGKCRSACSQLHTCNIL
jgi:hypothetical protein